MAIDMVKTVKKPQADEAGSAIKSVEDFNKIRAKFCPSCNECEEHGLCLVKFEVKCPKCGKTISVQGESVGMLLTHTCSDCRYEEEFGTEGILEHITNISLADQQADAMEQAEADWLNKQNDDEYNPTF